jgi:HEAT repeat protein
MAKDLLSEIAAMLKASSPEKRVAAAVVLKEVGAKSREVVDGLVSMLDTGSPPLQRPALDALVEIGSKAALPALLPLLGSRDTEVRARTVDAIAKIGPEALPKLKERIAAATPATMTGEERKAIDAAIARFGDSKDGVGTLLTHLEASDPEVARAVALEVRPQIKDADAKTRKLWLAELTKVLDRMKKSPPTSPIPMATAVKILGYLEDERTVPMLLGYAKDPKAPFAVRQEALIALRWAIAHDDHAAEVIDALVAAAEAPDRMLAQAALMGLVAVQLPKKHAGRIAKIAAHPDPERARMAIEKLAQESAPEATRALVDVVAKLDRRRGELAQSALEGRADAGPLLIEAFLAEKDADRANSLRLALRPHLKTVTGPAKKKLVQAALERIEADEPWQAHADVAREADGKAFVEGLRALAPTLAKKKTAAATYRNVLGLLSRSEQGSPEDRFKLASLLLRDSHLDTRPAARDDDEALQLLERASAGFDVAAALRKDKALELTHLYYVGFHFSEQQHPLGTELLEHVAKEGGRTKIGKMAKNKLGLSA